MNNKNIRKDNQEELKSSVLMGCCPHCFSKQIRYREFSANLEFGFDCFTCGWKGKYKFQEFLDFSEHWIQLNKPQDQNYR